MAGIPLRCQQCQHDAGRSGPKYAWYWPFPELVWQQLTWLIQAWAWHALPAQHGARHCRPADAHLQISASTVSLGPISESHDLAGPGETSKHGMHQTGRNGQPRP